MKILFYENSEGFSHYTSALCNAMIDLGNHVEIYYITNQNNSIANKVSNNVKLKTILKSYSKKYRKGSMKWLINRVFVSVYNIMKRNKYIRNEKPDVVSIQNTIPVFDQFFLSRIKKYSKVVITVHDVILPQKSKSWSMRSLKKIYSIADMLVVHSYKNKEQLCNIYQLSPEKIKVIHHGIYCDYEAIDEQTCKEKIGVNNGNITLLFYGSIRESKGLSILIKALNGVNCNLIIAGAMPYGESFTKYEELLKENVKHYWTYIQYVPDDLTNILFQACDIVVLPYVYFYSQSGVLMQSIQYKKPILATDVSCFKEYISKYDIGVVCEPNNVDALKKAIIGMISDRDKLLKYKENMEKARDDNTWDKSAAMHLELFEKACEGYEYL